MKVAASIFTTLALSASIAHPEPVSDDQLWATVTAKINEGIARYQSWSTQTLDVQRTTVNSINTAVNAIVHQCGTANYGNYSAFQVCISDLTFSLLRQAEPGAAQAPPKSGDMWCVTNGSYTRCNPD